MLLILENIIIYTYGTLVGYELNEDSIGLNLISSGPPKWVEDKYLTPERKAAAAKRREERIKQREEQAVASEFVAEQYYEHIMLDYQQLAPTTAILPLGVYASPRNTPMAVGGAAMSPFQSPMSSASPSGISVMIPPRGSPSSPIVHLPLSYYYSSSALPPRTLRKKRLPPPTDFVYAMFASLSQQQHNAYEMSHSLPSSSVV
jgi:hypothetical protein